MKFYDFMTLPQNDLVEPKLSIDLTEICAFKEYRKNEIQLFMKNGLSFIVLNATGFDNFKKWLETQ